MNYFERSLELSLEVRRNEAFDQLYYRKFPTLKKVESIDYETDREAQLKGMDKKLYFGDGSVKTVEEKVRLTAYNDIFLEVMSNDKKKKLGWLYTSQADYLTYFIEPTGMAYVLPLLLVRMAWVTNKDLWQLKYKKVVARNPNYNTIGYPIPVDVLIEAIKNEMVQKYS